MAESNPEIGSFFLMLNKDYYYYHDYFSVKLIVGIGNCSTVQLSLSAIENRNIKQKFGE